ncbi:hypothetical protein NE865_10422 [Phthorimaea operculella]|nr:hypothetical protein NE865_10422 [Phthorimaea operculella]
MDEETETQLKKICCTCLCMDRKLVQLCKIHNGVNNLYFLLSYDPEAYKEGFFKDLASLHVCWECRALIRRVACFRMQACAAQKHLSCPKTKQFKSFTKLSIHHKDSYDTVVSSTLDGLDDNFIDCNAVDVKTEIDDDDMPLSQLHNVVEKAKDSDNNQTGNNSENENHVSIMEPKDDYSDEDLISSNIIGKHKPKSPKLKIKRKKKEYYKTVLMSEKEMLDFRERRKLDVAFNDALNKCKSCLESFKDQDELEEHNTSKHSVKPDHTICDVCLCYIPTTSLLDHRNDHLLQYTCQLCEYSEFSIDEVTKHLDMEHGLKNLEVTVKRKKGVKTSKLRRCVVKGVKRTSLGFQCSECDKYFINRNQRWKHIQRVHREGFSCHSCGKRFAFRHTLNRHEQMIHSHDQPPREECPTCHKMIRVDLLKTHSQIHSEREKFSCVACDKTFVSRASYQHHLKYTMSHSNADILKYKCSMCDKGYRSRGELRDHENYQHKGQTKHQCPVCGKALATRRCITRHVRRAHHGVKEQARDKICQQCGKAFRDKKGLREHEFIHTGERPLSCEICGCSFRQSASLYTHKRRVHKIHAPRKQVQLMEER